VIAPRAAAPSRPPRPHHRARRRPGRPPDRPRPREILFIDEIHRLDARSKETSTPRSRTTASTLMIGSGPRAPAP
jgi:hypothetical protein